MVITINTDASFSEKYSLGTYAFWIICNKFKVLKSGVLRKKVKRPEVAEFRCIINAIHVALNQDCKDASLIIINTDCLNVIHLINKDRHAIQKYRLQSWGSFLCMEFESLLTRHQFKGKVEFRHVRAHTGISDKRSYVNEWCDSEAKKMLQSEIDQRKSKKVITKI